MEVLKHALKDGLTVFPFLVLVYLLMEILESLNNKSKIEKALSGKFAPLVSAGVGLVPECGFSVLCAKLYNSGLIGVGTLISAFIATSDEGLVVLLSGGANALDVIVLFLIKFVFAVIFGVIINRAFLSLKITHVCPDEGQCLECGEHYEKFVDRFVFHPLYHALKTFIFILAFNIILGYVIELVGQDSLIKFIDGSEFLQPLFSSLVGLIPNCASSILLSQGYLTGVITFSGLTAGLSANAGVGILLLFKNKNSIKRALLIIAILLICSLIIGYVTLLGEEILTAVLK